MIGIVGEAIKLEISRRVKAAGMFAVLMDETTDVSHKELLASIEKDILLQLDDADLVARFASKADRRMLLA